MKKLPDYIQKAIEEGRADQKTQQERRFREEAEKTKKQQDKEKKDLEDARSWAKNLLPYSIRSAVAEGKNRVLLGIGYEAKAKVAACREIGMEVEEIEDNWDGPGGDISYFVCW